MSQGGDVSDGTGKGDPHFHIADETFAVKHDGVGILGMANNGPDAPHSAATQLTRQPIPSQPQIFLSSPPNSLSPFLVHVEST